jgi:transposase
MGYTVKKASTQLNLKFSTCKAIVKHYKETGSYFKEKPEKLI